MFIYENILEKLNTAQQEAVIHIDGPLLVVAGAGSGKTRILIYRIAHLIQQGINPENILAVTFTKKAALEMKERVWKLGIKNNNLFIGTFHSFCARILRKEYEKLNINKDFTIFDDQDQLKLIKKIFEELKITLFTPQQVISAINWEKNQLITFEKMLQEPSLWRKEIGKIYQKYQESLELNNALDFGDLIMKTVELFKKNPDILTHYQEIYKYILVDEYQDTNISQYYLIKLLGEKYKNVCVVGDPDQSIYAWRGANIGNILNFESNYQNTKIIKMEQNYRSTYSILQASNSLIKNNLSRYEKNLWTNNNNGEQVKYILAENQDAEVNFIIDEIKNLQKQGFALKDIVLFYRIHALSRILENGFRRENLPYTIVGGVSFYQRKEIKDILAYLKVIINPKDEINLRRIINFPTRGIGDESLKKIENYSKTKAITLFEGLKEINLVEDISLKTKESICNFVDLIKECQELKKSNEVKKIIEQILNETGYWEMLLKENTEESFQKRENLKELISSAYEFEKKSPEPNLSIYLEEISLSADIDMWKEEKNTVTFMTLHNAKGLEFKICFMIGLEEEIFPHFLSLESQQEIEEERRLCYVGMTRAKEKLYLSAAKERIVWGKRKNNSVSRFIREIDEDFLEKKEAIHYSYVSSNANIYNSKKIYENNANKNNEKQFNKGQMVFHPYLGKGVIQDKEGDKVIVFFPQSGNTKKLSLMYADLKIL
ncbi:MAG: UvrD-helicase domain-containing protein [bacterium]